MVLLVLSQDGLVIGGLSIHRILMLSVKLRGSNWHCSSDLDILGFVTILAFIQESCCKILEKRLSKWMLPPNRHLWILEAQENGVLRDNDAKPSQQVAIHSSRTVLLIKGSQKVSPFWNSRSVRKSSTTEVTIDFSEEWWLAKLCIYKKR